MLVTSFANNTCVKRKLVASRYHTSIVRSTELLPNTSNYYKLSRIDMMIMLMIEQVRVKVAQVLV